MNFNGAVICFHKYHGNKEVADFCVNNPVCLGYFGRAFVTPVSQFKDYIRIVSDNHADRTCSRKQLLLHCFDDAHLAEEIEIVSEDDCNGKALCFCDNGGKRYPICCCTVINLNSAHALPIQQAASLLYDKFSKTSNRKFRFAITGLLGAEDLCVIILSESYEAISDAFSIIQNLRTPDDKAYVVDNTHSILALDTMSEYSKNIVWGNTRATVHFSLRTIGGMQYLKQIRGELEKEKYQVSLNSQSGEYDAVLTGPARILTEKLYNDGGYLAYNKPEAWHNIYQVETTLQPFGSAEARELRGTPGDISSENDDRDELDSIVRDTIDKATRFLLEASELQGICSEENGTGEELFVKRNISQTIHRLEKDYYRIVLHPYGGILRDDLKMQFIAMLNVIVKAAETCRDKWKACRDMGEPGGGKAYDEFYRTMSDVTDAFMKSMEAVCQSDGLGFHEQLSYLQNVGSYYKVIACYYGIIKDILRILYGVKHKAGSEQYYLIPMLSFGLTPIPKSDSYRCIYNGKEAHLISITLPYHALNNPAKYLGVLVHEVFHYAAPGDREKRNVCLANCLVSIALSEFLDVLARGQKLGSAVSFGNHFYKDAPGVFDTAVKKWVALIREKIDQEARATGKLPEFSAQRTSVLKRNIRKYLRFEQHPDAINYDDYYRFWAIIRKMLLSYKDSVSPEIRCVFALDQPDSAQAFRKLVESIKPKDLIDMEQRLEICSTALGELRPDLFDLAVVLYGKDEKTKLNKYLWQIYGIEDNIGMPFVKSRISMSYNSFRFGTVIDGLLPDETSETKVKLLNDALDGWNSTPRYARFKEIKLNECRAYFEYSRPFSKAVAELRALSALEIESLARNPDCVAAMKRLTKYYGRYTELCDQQVAQQQSTQPDEMFKLCCEILYAYENQESFSRICKSGSPVLTKDASATPAAPQLEIPKHSDCASSAADLASAIRIAYQAMSINHTLPILWYRGQEDYRWPCWPNIMHTHNKQLESFSAEIADEIRWARARILPQGHDFDGPGWIAFLQHHEFKTNALDFSESLHPALYFATEKWSRNCGQMPEQNAALKLFNPVLFNLAMDALEKASGDPVEREDSVKRLKHYLKEGKEGPDMPHQPPLFAAGEPIERYQYLFNWDKAARSKEKAGYPCAALVPQNSVRMKQQIGQFVYYDLRCKAEPKGDEYSFECWSLESLQEEYFEFLKIVIDPKQDKDLEIVPFLYTIEINRERYADFKEYQYAIGMRTFRVYPEYDKMAKDLAEQLHLE